MTRRLVVVRHGETDWNREGRMQGWAPVPLNDQGRRQASAVGRWLAEKFSIDAIHSSDLRRCRQTARTIQDAFDGEPPLFEEPAWRERDVGIYQGLTYDEMVERYPSFGLGEPAAQAATERPESGESLVEVADRVTDRAAELLEAGGSRLVVTHGGPMQLLAGNVKDLDATDAVLAHTAANCGVTLIEADGDGQRLVVENQTAWRAQLD